LKRPESAKVEFKLSKGPGENNENEFGYGPSFRPVSAIQNNMIYQKFPIFLFFVKNNCLKIQ